MPTEDPLYEEGRRERMQARKPRFAKYEMERMTIRELKALLPRRVSAQFASLFSDKDEVIEFLIKHEIVDLINMPPPVEFPSLAVLRAMGVGQLKRTMNDTGVYFDPKDVVEKEDMIQIFINSGRICLLEHDAEGDTNDNNTGSYGHAPCDDPNRRQRGYSFDDNDNDDDYDDESKKKDDANADENSNGSATTANDDAQQNINAGSSSIRSPIQVETVTEHEDSPTAQARNNNNLGNRSDSGNSQWDSSVVMEETNFPNNAPTANDPSSTTDAKAATATTNTTNNRDTNNDQSPDNNDPEDAMSLDSVDATAAAPEAASLKDDENEDASGSMDDSETSRKRRRAELEEDENLDEDVVEETSQFQSLSISELRSMARDQGVDLSTCVERREMVDRLSSAGSSASGANDDVESQENDNTRAQSATAAATSSISADFFQSWNVSHLRACANSVEVDLSKCKNHAEMVQALLDAASERPHVANYLTALSPLMGMSISQLRALGREWHVDINNCLEKGEMIRRLAAASASQGSSSS